ncbi:sex hormone-binding globulin [Bombina bombina]|uniref:sex hormone-binding globulin n=1 Tax=Bombina bombina TaxID=8345 RepID=UPI00235A9898|nr:sex hormone-binding globulin [Bombina bombina]
MKNCHILLFIWIFSLRDGRAEEPSCYGGFLDPEQHINIGQKWGLGLPARTVHIDMTKVTSSSSCFEVRTFDPEGVLIFGDTRNGQDWFLLGLRDGRPEIQICNQIAKLSVAGGPKINDGEWHKILVRSDEHRIVLEVDDQETLRIGHVTEVVSQSLDTTMRIAVGGILTNHTYLMEPLVTPLDGCLRNWVWLSLTPEWLHDPASLNPPKRCFSSHRRGSYFPGTGKAVYKTTDIIPVSQDSQWYLSVQIQLHSETNSFSLLSISHPNGDLVLSLKGEHKNLILELGNTTVLSLSLPELEGCEGALLLLEVTQTSITLQYGGKEEQKPLTEEEYVALRDAWQSGGYLYLGGGPEESTQYFHGCLRNIIFQGTNLDLDSALYKSDSIWSHSCPKPDKDII